MQSEHSEFQPPFGTHCVHVQQNSSDACAFGRSVDGATRHRQQQLARHIIAATGLRHVRDLLPYVTTTANAAGTVTCTVQADRLRRDFPPLRSLVPTVTAIVRAWPAAWADAIHRGAEPLRTGEWICLQTATPNIGVVTRAPAQLGGHFTVRLWSLDHTYRLTDSGVDVSYWPRAAQPARRAIVWVESARNTEDFNVGQNVQNRQEWSDGKHVYGGLMEADAVHFRQWRLRSHRTLVRPTTVTFDRMRNRDLYACLISRVFETGEGYPTAFRPGTGAWSHLIQGAGEAYDKQVAKVFATARCTTCIPNTARQAAYQMHTCSLPIGTRVGGGLCPMCCPDVMGPINPRHHETHEHVAWQCDAPFLLWRHVLSAWSAKYPAETWAAGTHAAQWSRADMTPNMIRAITLGLRPTEAQPEAFALLRALTLHEVVRTRHMAAVLRADSGLRAGTVVDHIATATGMYERLCANMDRALTNERARMAKLERQWRARGLPVPRTGPLKRWTQKWITSGVATCDAQGRVSNRILPRQPLASLGQTDSTHPIAIRAPRPDMAPPAQLPNGTFVLYVGSHATDTTSGWGFTITHSGDGNHDTMATLTDDYFGPVLTTRAAAPYTGATRHHAETAGLTAIVETLTMALVTPAVQNAPAVLLRLDCSLAARVAAGVGVPAQQDEGLRKTVRDLWKRAREQWQGAFWATWTRNDRGHAWNERARALALIGSTGRVMGGSRWGGYTHASDAPEWIGVDEKVRDEECSICLTAFSDWLPTPDDASRSAPDLFACRTHAVCRQCDVNHQASANNRCPLCRAARTRVYATDGNA